MALRTSTARLVKLGGGGSLSTPAQRSTSTTKAKDLFHEARSCSNSFLANLLFIADTQASSMEVADRSSTSLQIARTLPWVLSNYKLEEITTVRELRSNVARLFKLHSHMKNEGVRAS